MPDINKMLGIRIKKLRCEKNMTQEVLSEKVDVSIKYLGELEHGRGNPTLKQIKKLASALDLKIHELLDFDQRAKPDFELKEEIITRLDKVETETLRLLYMILRP